jgi:hypothetical protein|nr:hypothetical protein [Bradyrhizobium sp. CCH1-B1]
MAGADLNLDLSTLDRDLAAAERERAAARLSRLSPQGAALLSKTRAALAQGRISREPPSPSVAIARANSGQQECDGGAIGEEGAE